MKFADDNERELLNACQDTVMTTDTRNRIFEFIVIGRCIRKTAKDRPFLTLGNESFKLPERRLEGSFQSLKLLSKLYGAGIFVPLNSSFPASEFIWKQARIEWGVQVHVGAHGDVLKEFKSMCLEAQWKAAFDTLDTIFALFKSFTKCCRS